MTWKKTGVMVKHEIRIEGLRLQIFLVDSWLYDLDQVT